MQLMSRGRFWPIRSSEDRSDRRMRPPDPGFAQADFGPGPGPV